MCVAKFLRTWTRTTLLDKNLPDKVFAEQNSLSDKILSSRPNFVNVSRAWFVQRIFVYDDFYPNFGWGNSCFKANLQYCGQNQTRIKQKRLNGNLEISANKFIKIKTIPWQIFEVIYIKALFEYSRKTTLKALIIATLFLRHWFLRMPDF